MNKEAAQERKAAITSQFDKNTQDIASLQAEQNRLQGEYRLLEDIINEPDKKKQDKPNG